MQGGLFIDSRLFQCLRPTAGQGPSKGKAQGEGTRRKLGKGERFRAFLCWAILGGLAALGQRISHHWPLKTVSRPPTYL